jgi:histidinol-phosphate aminotransferase
VIREKDKLFIQRNSYLRYIDRIRVPESRDLENGLRLDRNEKVDLWPKDFLFNIFSAKPEYFMSVYPEHIIGSFYGKLSEHLKVEKNQIMLTSGVEGGIKILFELMTSPGDIAGIFSCSYAMYKVYSMLFQVNLHEVGYNEDFTLDMKELDSLLNRKPNVLFIPNPNLPVATPLSIDELADIARKAYEKNCLCVIDETYHMFGSDTAMPLLNDFENIVILRAFSKGFGVPSIRLGYMVSNEENMQILSKTRFAYECNALSVAVAEYLLDNYDMVKKNIDRVVEGRTYVQNELAKLGLETHGSKSNFLLVNLQSCEKATMVVSRLAEKLIYVKGPLKPPWVQYICITIGPVSHMKIFIDAIKDIIS